MGTGDAVLFRASEISRKKVFGTYVHSETAELLLYMLVDKFTVFLGDEIFKVAGNLLDAL